MDSEIPMSEDGIKAKVQEALDMVRPSLQSHGGDVTLVEVTSDKIARLQLEGACSGCPMSQITLKMGIERVLTQEVPELAGVEAVGLEHVDWSQFE
jgi:Fe-S cluster biogenesis protein NfuA